MSGVWADKIIVGVIRIGYFEGFKGHDTLLLAGDNEGLDQFERWVRGRVAGSSPERLDQCPYVQPWRGLRLVAAVAPREVGLVRGPDGGFAWGRTVAGWTSVADQIAVLRAAGAGHEYLECGSDRVVPMASLGEYSDAWWSEHSGEPVHAAEEEPPSLK